MKIVKSTWHLVFSEKAAKEFKEIDSVAQKRIQKKLETVALCGEPPQKHMKNLTGNLRHLHSLRVGHYRVLCEVKSSTLTILAVSIAHRRHIYAK